MERQSNRRYWSRDKFRDSYMSKFFQPGNFMDGVDWSERTLMDSEELLTKVSYIVDKIKSS